jgi:hypothetical protein
MREVFWVGDNRASRPKHRRVSPATEVGGSSPSRSPTGPRPLSSSSSVARVCSAEARTLAGLRKRQGPPAVTPSERGGDGDSQCALEGQLAHPVPCRPAPGPRRDSERGIDECDEREWCQERCPESSGGPPTSVRGRKGGARSQPRLHSVCQHVAQQRALDGMPDQFLDGANGRVTRRSAGEPHVDELSRGESDRSAGGCSSHVGHRARSGWGRRCDEAERGSVPPHSQRPLDANCFTP